MPKKETKEVIESTLYKGKVAVRFFPKSHVYMMNGKRKSGVTTYIGIKDKSRPLVIWATALAKSFLIKKLEDGGIDEGVIIEACGLHAVRKEEASTIGSIAHEWIEEYIAGNSPEMPEDPCVLIAVNGFLDWEKEHKVKFLSSERVLYSKKHDYMGKMDIEAKVDGDLCLVDIKTSNALYNDYCMQTAAYVKADEEESGRKYKGRWLVRIAKETEEDYILRMDEKGKVDYPPYVAFEAKYLDNEAGNIDRDFEAFLACKKLFEWNKKTDFWING